jgi:hypothetical protein
MHLPRSSIGLAVLRGPPVLQVALGVVLAALVVEAVGELVADGGAGVAVVGRVVHLRVEERRLQDAGGEVDVVDLRVVVRVHRGRGHVPLAAVDGLADLGRSRRDSNCCAHDVAEEVVARTAMLE